MTARKQVAGRIDGMNRIKDKLVLITGASSGFGEACARRFAADGARLMLWARRRERLERLQVELSQQHGVDVKIERVDVRDRDTVLALGDELAAANHTPDILVNNAGLASGLDTIQEGDFDDWDRMIDTNVKGLLNVTRAVLPLMVKRDSGHVVNIGSIAGRVVYPKGNVYNASKFAVRALNEAMNIDLIDTNIRVSTIDPGAAETEFSAVRFHGDEERAQTVYDGFEPLSAADVADAVLYVVNAPEHVNVTELVIMPTAQRNPYLLRRGNK
jgi:3-hydroxy acid dehydrogenase/malonic semialdehyde reductase